MARVTSASNGVPAHIRTVPSSARSRISPAGSHRATRPVKAVASSRSARSAGRQRSPLVSHRRHASSTRVVQVLHQEGALPVVQPARPERHRIDRHQHRRRGRHGRARDADHVVDGHRRLAQLGQSHRHRDRQFHPDRPLVVDLQPGHHDALGQPVDAVPGGLGEQPVDPGLFQQGHRLGVVDVPEGVQVRPPHPHLRHIPSAHATLPASHVARSTRQPAAQQSAAPSGPCRPRGPPRPPPDRSGLTGGLSGSSSGSPWPPPTAPPGRRRTPRRSRPACAGPGPAGRRSPPPTARSC